MFRVNLETMEITMHRGDTGSFKLHATRGNGDDWTADDRALFTVRDGTGTIVLQRFYRLDDQYGLGNGVILIEFHNDDTDDWEPGQYTTEVRFNVDPIWEGTAPTSRCANALTADAKMVEGSVVRTTIQSSLTISAILGEI